MGDFGIVLALVLVVALAVACFCWMLFGDPKWARFSPTDPTLSPPIAIAITTPRTPPLSVIAIDSSDSARVPYQAIRADYIRDNRRECDLLPVVVVVVEPVHQTTTTR